MVFVAPSTPPVYEGVVKEEKSLGSEAIDKLDAKL